MPAPRILVNDGKYQVTIDDSSILGIGSNANCFLGIEKVSGTQVAVKLGQREVVFRPHISPFSSPASSESGVLGKGHAGERV